MPENLANLPNLSEDLGILVVGHGTRNQQGQAEFLQTAQQLQTLLPGRQVEACFLELAEPDIPTAMAALAANNVRRLVVAPCLLFTAGHAKADIPDAVTAAAVRHGIKFTSAETLGEDPRMIEASRQVCQAAIEQLPLVPEEKTLLVMAGRGSSDPAAQAAMHRFAAARSRSAGLPVGEVCFLAAARPSLDDLLADESRLRPFDRLIVQPHLLFQGRLTEQIDQALQTWQTTRPDSLAHLQPVRTPHLGPQPAIAAVLADRIAAAALQFTTP